MDDAGPDEDSGPKNNDAGAGTADTMHDAAPSTGGAGAPSPDAGELLGPSDVAAVLARGRCGALEACMGKSLVLESLNGIDCVDYTTSQFADRDLHWLAKAVAASRVTFRPELLQKCQQDIVALGCEYRSRRLPTSCEEAVEGKAALDEPCSIDQECEGTAYCDQGQLATCPGFCAAPQTAGLPCGASDQCADGLTCINRTCSVPLTAGDVCSTLGVRSECPAGLVCQGTSGNLTCQSIAALYVAKLGAACDAFGKLCERGLVCRSQSASSTTGVCAELAAAGGVCRRSVPSQCPLDQYCKDAKPAVTARAAVGVDGTCAALPTDGKKCDADVGCAPGAVCLGDELCHSYRSVGAACDDALECYSNECVEGVCAAPLECLM